ncbi:DUF3899 domain-containing protein [Chengkuizengella axinellae]|uniref:DUF3899 domain-containing protein n=1 Tax=Chengkuizengella axinellae TaxID=3064388 RepID=A0ABT9IVF0_9BACL|nr:DUF3899 domain-containing protein [Chengkuizengella sp. 2205SS18-9]MDP5273340.1 DUF3899 domain-containing protein [Chengkuizengella sp. 2205SS18-9]
MYLYNKKVILFNIFIFLAPFFLSLLYYKEITLVSYINSIFIISAVFLLLGLFLIVVRGGFFDFFYSSIRKVVKRTTRQGEMLGDDIDSMRLPSEMSEFNFIKPLLVTGLVLFCIMMLCLLFYYL